MAREQPSDSNHPQGGWKATRRLLPPKGWQESLININCEATQATTPPYHQSETPHVAKTLAR